MRGVEGAWQASETTWAWAWVWAEASRVESILPVLTALVRAGPTFQTPERAARRAGVSRSRDRGLTLKAGSPLSKVA